MFLRICLQPQNFNYTKMLTPLLPMITRWPSSHLFAKGTHPRKFCASKIFRYAVCYVYTDMYVCMYFICMNIDVGVHVLVACYHNIIGASAHKESQPHHSVGQAPEDNTGQNYVFIVELDNQSLLKCFFQQGEVPHCFAAFAALWHTNLLLWNVPILIFHLEN